MTDYEKAGLTTAPPLKTVSLEWIKDVDVEIRASTEIPADPYGYFFRRYCGRAAIISTDIAAVKELIESNELYISNYLQALALTNNAGNDWVVGTHSSHKWLHEQQGNLKAAVGMKRFAYRVATGLYFPHNNRFMGLSNLELEDAELPVGFLERNSPDIPIITPPFRFPPLSTLLKTL